MKHLGVLLLPPGQDASPSQRYPTAECPCPRKQRDGQGLNPGHPDPKFEVLPTRSRTPPQKEAYGCTNEAPVGGRGGEAGGRRDFLIRHSELVKYPATFPYSHLLPKFLATLLIRSKTVSSKKLF